MSSGLQGLQVDDKQHKQDGQQTVFEQSVLEVTIPEFTLASGLLVAGAFFAAFVTAGFANSFGVFQEYYGTHELRDKSAFQIVWLASFQSFVLFAFSPVSGTLTDRLGAFIPLTVGAVVMPLSVFMTSLCSEYYQFFLAQGLLMGVGMSFLVIPAIATVSKTFKKHNGLAMGIVISGSSIGGVIWPIEADQLLHSHKMSFGWTMRILGFTMLPLCAFILVANRPRRYINDPHTATVDGDIEKTDLVESMHVAGKPTKPAKKKMDNSILKNRTFLWLCPGVAVLFLGFFTPVFFVTSYGVARGLSQSFSFYLTSITCAASFFGRVAPGFYADRYGPFNVLTLSAISSAIIAFCWTATTSTAGIVVWSLAYGFSSGSFLSLQTSCAAKLSTPETRGMAIGLIMGGGAITGLFGPPISGALLQYGYLALSMYVGSVLTVGSLLIVGARLQQDKRLRAVV